MKAKHKRILGYSLLWSPYMFLFLYIGVDLFSNIRFDIFGWFILIMIVLFSFLGLCGWLINSKDEREEDSM